TKGSLRFSDLFVYRENPMRRIPMLQFRTRFVRK
ncbi:MAG: hypothetical protein K0S14_1815, partial [Thermomicrobiales bacterium]|nr:hypothetical protein [Thermomicrobiales bacterium]